MLLLVSCNVAGSLGNIIPGISGNEGGNSEGEGGAGSGANDYDPTKPLIWNPKTDVSFVTTISGNTRQTISDKFTELTGITFTPSSDANPKGAHEVVIGESSRPIAQTAYHILDRNMTEDEDAEGYVILVQDGSVAVAYSSEASFEEAMNAFYSSCCQPNYYADNGPVHWDFYSQRAKAEQNRDKMYEEGFARLEQQLTAAGIETAKDIVKEIKIYYTLFKTEQLYWLSDLYDPELGAFYYSNSGRDNLGFLPDIESTGQAFMMLDRSGLFDAVGGFEGNDSGNKLPAFIAEPMTEWLRGLQDSETGYFLHPQWGGDIASSRRARDLDNVVSLFTKYLRTQPYYNDPSNRLKGTLGAPGADAPRPASALSTRLGTSAIQAVSKITPAASSLPSYLQSISAWQEYLNSKDINASGVSYSFGNTLVSDWSLIKAAGPEYVTTVIDYLNEHQIAEIGLWEYQNENDYDPDDKVGYNGTNGLMKICVLYGSLGYAVPNAYNALQSTIKVGLYPNTDPKDETVCYGLNIWTCLGSMMGNIKAHDPENYPAAQKLLIDNLPELIRATYDLQNTHLMPDGGFSYFERRSMNISQSASVGCAQGPESDINATMVATTSTIGAMYGAIKNAVDGIITSVPIWGYDDYFLYMNELKNAGKVYKNEVPDAELITFDDYAENDVEDGSERRPHDLIGVSVNTKFFNSTVVQRPGTAFADEDLALRLESTLETQLINGAYKPMKDENNKDIIAPAPSNVNISMGNMFGNGNCYSVQADLMVEEGSNTGKILELLLQDNRLGSNQRMTGLSIEVYELAGERYVRVKDLYVGPDGSYTTFYENVKVGEWFNLRADSYLIYTQNEDETTSVELYTKVYINDMYVGTSDTANLVGGKVNAVEVDTAIFSLQRFLKSTVYFDNIMCERRDAEFVREWEPTDPTIPDVEIPEGEDYNYIAEFDGTMVNDAFMFNYANGVNTGKPGFDPTKYAHVTEYSLATDVGGRAGQVLRVHQKHNTNFNGSWSYLKISNARPEGNTYTYETKLYYEYAKNEASITELYFDGKDANGATITMLRLAMIKKGGNVVIYPYNSGSGGTGLKYEALANVTIPMQQWVTLRIEMYFTGDPETTRVKFYTDTDDGTLKFVADYKLYHSLAAAEGIVPEGGTEKVLPVMNQLRLFHLRTNEVISYYDDMSLTRTDKEYVKEVLHNEVTFDNGNIICTPSISVNTGSGSIEKGVAEGGNDRNYFKIRDDVEGKIGDAVLEVYHKAGMKDAAGLSNISVGITDGSGEGNIYVLDFDMKVNVVEKYNSTSDFFTRVRVGSAGNAGLYQQLTVNPEGKVVCQNNGVGQTVLGDTGEWIHVKMIYNMINPSNINLTDPSAHTVEFYLVVVDAEGNETLVYNTSLYTSYVANNKDVSRVFFTGREGNSDFDQQYFLDNITYVRTTDASVIPEIPAEPAE